MSSLRDMKVKSILRRLFEGQSLDYRYMKKDFPFSMQYESSWMKTSDPGAWTSKKAACNTFYSMSGLKVGKLILPLI